MTLIRTILRISIFCVLFIFGSSNQAYAKSKKELMEESKIALENAEKGGVVLGMAVTSECKLTFNNLDTKERIEISTNHKVKIQDYKRKSRFGLTLLEPGNYDLGYGSCVFYGHNQKTTVRHSFQKWYDPFEIKGGEILYLGQVNYRNLSHQVDGVLDFVPNFLVKPPKDRYRTYNITNELEDTLKAFNKKSAKKWAWILPYVKEDILNLRLDEDIIKKIIADSYKSSVSENGKIDGRLARSKVNRAYSQYQLTGNYNPN